MNDQTGQHPKDEYFFCDLEIDKMSLRELSEEGDDGDFLTADEGEEQQVLDQNMMLGDNERVQLMTSGDACIDLFGTWIPSSDIENVEEKLALAWDENDLMTLKMIFHKGNARDKGGGDSLNFVRAYLWLFRNHSKTALENVQHIARNSSLQTLLLVTKFILYDPEHDLVDSLFTSSKVSSDTTQWHLKNSQLKTHKISHHASFPRQSGFAHHNEFSKKFKTSVVERKEAGNFRKYRQMRHIIHVEEFVATKYPNCVLADVYKVCERTALPPKQPTPKVQYKWVNETLKQEWLEFVKHKNTVAKEEAKRERSARVKATRTGIVHYLEGHKDSHITALLLLVRDIFVNGMLVEIKQMLAQHPSCQQRNGLFHKWAPTRGGSMDKATNLGYMIQQEIVRKLCEISDHPLSSLGEGLLEYIPQLHKMTPQMKYERILRLMRKRSFIPESFVGSNNFHDVDYTYMPGKCLLVHGKSVFKHNDEWRYVSHFENASKKLDKALLARDVKAIKKASKLVKVDSTETHTIMKNAMIAYRSAKKELKTGNGSDASKAVITDLRSDANVCKLQFISLLSEFMDNKKSRGSSWIPVVDTSGSMDGSSSENTRAKPIDVAITLGVLVSMVNNPESRWFCRMVTFDETPEVYHMMHGIESDGDCPDNARMQMFQEDDPMEESESSKNGLDIRLDSALKNNVKDLSDIVDLINTDDFMLGKIVSGVKNMPWGGNTNLVAVFQKQLAPLLQAQTEKSDMESVLRERIASENMIIFTDMQFDGSDGHCTHHGKNGLVSKRGLLIMEEITEMYKTCGITTVPKIVFWNLDAEVGTPSGAGAPGVTMVTGFSAGMLNFFMDDDLAAYDPSEYLALQLDVAAYHDLVICD